MTKTIARFLFTFLICHAAAGTTWAQPEGPLNHRVSGAFCGRVYAGSSPQFVWPADNAEVDLLRAEDNRWVARASTDSNGGYKFSSVPPGVYRVGLPAFKTTSDTVTITGAGQRKCKRPLIVVLYLIPIESDGQQSRVLTKLPPNFANEAGPVTKERGDAGAEINAGTYEEQSLDEQERHFRAAIRIDPSYWLPHVNLALVLVDRKMAPEAEAEFREAVRVGPRNEVPYWQLTTFLMDRGRSRDAESALNQARKDRISSAGVSASLGLLAFQKRNWKEAERQFRVALEYTPESLFGFKHWGQWETLLAVALSRQGKSAEANRHFRELLESWDGVPWVLNMVGYEMVERGTDLEEAARILDRALAAEPDNAAILDSLGWANYKLGRASLAEEQLKQAATRLPDHPDVLEHLGELYAATGRKDDARSVITTALKHATEAEARKRLSARLKQLN